MADISARRRTGLALAFYTLLTVVLTWPLAAHFTTHVTGDGIDDPALAWNLWWAKARLVDQLNPDIFHVGWMFHPIDINLAFYTLTPLNGLLSLPLQSAFTLVVANNLLLWLSYILGGFGAYLLALELLRQWHSTDGARGGVAYPEWLAALVAGMIYAFASSKLFYAALGQFNIASSLWIPFCILYWMRSLCATTRRRALYCGAMAGLFLVFQAWAELTYATFLLVFAAWFAVWAVFANWRRTLLTLGASAVVFALGLAPFLWAMLPDLRVEGDFFGSGGGFADVFSADLMGYLVPTRLHPWLGAWVATLPFPNDKGQQIFLGYTVVALALLGLWVLVRRGSHLRRWAWLWGGALLLFWLLTLGPQVRWAGAPLPIPGPFALISRLPFFSGNRYPSRYSVMLMLAAAVLAAAGLAWLLRRRSLRLTLALFGVVCALVLVEHLSVPLPLSDFRIPAIYTRLAAEASATAPAAGPDDSALLELPTGWRNGARVLGKSDILIMMQEWYQTAHGLRRLGGNTSRNPAYKFQYFTEAPLIGDLIALMNADQPHLAPVIDAQLDDMIARDRPLAAEVLTFLGVKYITLHVDKAPAALQRFVEAALPVELISEETAADWTGAPATIRLYRVNAPSAPPTRRIEMNGALAPLYLGEGWSAFTTPDGARYATRPAPLLLVDLPAAGSQLVLEWADPALSLNVTVNGQPVSATRSDAAPAEWRIDVPPGVANEPVDRVQISFSGAGVPASQLAVPPVGQGWPVGSTGVQLAAGAPVTVRSAGEEAGNFAQIYVGGKDVAANQRGYNLVAVSPAGAVLDSVAFDTFAADAAATAMAQWLDRWPAGTVILGAVADEASMHLNAEAVRALQHVGVAGDLRGKFRSSHAFVGASGAAPGTAIEQMSLISPAAAYAGTPFDGSTAYGGLRSIQIQSKE